MRARLASPKQIDGCQRRGSLIGEETSPENNAACLGIGEKKGHIGKQRMDEDILCID